MNAGRRKVAHALLPVGVECGEAGDAIISFLTLLDSCGFAVFLKHRQECLCYCR